MPKLLTIALREFTYNLRRPAFLFAVFGTPAIIAIAFILGAALEGGDVGLDEYGRVGYVDLSAEQVLAQDLRSEEHPDIFTRYASAETAEADVRAGTLAAYFELPPNYLDTGRVTLYTMENAPEELIDAIDATLRENLSAGVPNQLAVDLLARGPNFDVTVQDGNRTFDENGAFFVTLLPVIFGFLLIMSSVITSSFLMSGLVEEKTNRIMEVLVTSVSPMQLLLGKLLGMGVLGMLQVLTFLLAGIVGISIAQQNNVLSGVSIPADMVVLAIVYYLLSYFLLASIGIAIGAVVGSEQESRQLSAIFVMPVMLPYILLVSFIIDPNGTVPTVLSLIPFTAPMAVLMRSGMTTVPLWQIAVSIGGLVLLNVIVMWTAARLFRWGVLNTNKTPGLRRLFQILRGRTPEITPAPPRQPESA